MLCDWEWALIREGLVTAVSCLELPCYCVLLMAVNQWEIMTAWLSFLFVGCS